ncbi:SpoIIE family protein phosphatase [Tichowtungia aerotolerans]|uniref:SpoIIE family protein phosphatase n=1 Tax=Tichowtungia aerotolerans TaxID=2697043 RepID=A0A6P1M5V7_9BACT|nr:SpoIIE family protein phosphatase [Tichowtungia aerotolerans]QHI68383.1 SpoIIE family protein phosphatase [Tichowtungia aerotolerans]
MENLFKEVEVYQVRKASELACGDVFLSNRDPLTDRLVSVLSDGLGSGVKANVLAAMTAQMALKFTLSELDMERSAEIMMNALPICAVRKIGYATYTIVDCQGHRSIRIVEQGSPRFIYIRQGRVIDLPFEELGSRQRDYRTVRITTCVPQPEDRIIFFSDGITESGMGTPNYRLGWRHSGVVHFVQSLLSDDPEISARTLVRRIVREALNKEPSRRAGDDTTCAAVYVRRPRRTLVLSGPPYDSSRDREVAGLLAEFDGRTAVCGGTSAEIVSRELGRPLHTPILRGRSTLPPVSRMEGVDLVTEGILTLTEVLRRLDHGDSSPTANAATQLVDLLLESDVIELVVGTRINDAHQDPNLPVDLEIRRNLMKRIKRVLEEKYLKEVNIRYI